MSASPQLLTRNKSNWIICIPVWLVLASTVAAQDRHDRLASRIHALLVYDNEVPGAQNDAAEMLRVLRAAFVKPKNFPDDKITRIPIAITLMGDGEAISNHLADSDPEAVESITVIQGTPTPDKVRRYYREFDKSPSETLLFFYAGHGATGKKGHILQIPGGSMYRHEIRSLIAAKQPRLSVVLTDCCANYLPGTVPFPRAQVKWKVLRGLLGRHRGVVDINASPPGDSSFGDQGGGVFSQTITHLFCAPPPEVGGTKGYETGFVPWNEFFVFVKHHTKRNYETFKKKHVDIDQASLTPHAFSLPPWRFGVRVVARNGSLRITQVFEGSPAHAAGLRKGDTIERLDGRPVRSEVGYAKIIDSKDGGALSVKLRRAQRPIMIPLAW